MTRFEKSKNNNNNNNNISKTQGDRNMRFVLFCLGNKGIYVHQFTNLVTKLVNR